MFWVILGIAIFVAAFVWGIADREPAGGLVLGLIIGGVIIGFAALSDSVRYDELVKEEILVTTKNLDVPDEYVRVIGDECMLRFLHVYDFESKDMSFKKIKLGCDFMVEKITEIHNRSFWSLLDSQHESYVLYIPNSAILAEIR